MNEVPVDWISLWIQACEAIATVAIAGIVAWIAWRQHRLDKNKLKWDQYDRRLKAYKAIKRILSLTAQLGNFPEDDHDALREFWEARSESDFIFDHRVQNYFDQIWEHAVKLMSHEKRLESERLERKERKKIVDASSAEFRWFVEQLKNHPNIFRPYLTISE